MPYVPNADDVTQPVSSVDPSTAAAEFRAIKVKLQGLGVGYNVRTNGALGNNVANDTAAFNAALTAAAAVGLPLYVPPGKYRISAIAPPAGVPAIYGNGKGITVLRRIDADTAQRSMVYITTPNFGLRSLTVDGNLANNITYGSIGILAYNTYNTEIFDIESINHAAYSGAGSGLTVLSNIDFANNTQTSVVNSRFATNGSNGVYISGCKNVILDGNKITANATNGLAVDTNTIFTNGTVQHIKIVNNFISNNTLQGMYCSAFNNFATTAMQFITVEGNTCNFNGALGIAFDCDQSSCSNNVVEGNGTGAGNYGILSNCTSSKINNNLILNNGGFGVDAGGSRDFEFVGNTLIGNNFSPLNLGAVAGALIEGNTFKNNVTGSGADIKISAYDDGGVAFATLGKNITIRGNRFVLGSNTCYGISCGSITGFMCQGNTFEGGNPLNYIFTAHLSGYVNDNKSVDYPKGYNALMGGTVVYPDYSDTIILTGATQNIGQFVSISQNFWAGRISGGLVAAGGVNYTAPTVNIVGDGISGTGQLITLNAPAAGPIGLIYILNSGTGYTYANAVVSDPSGTGALISPIYVGAAAVVDGREFTVVNNSGNPQTLFNGAIGAGLGIQLSGGSNFSLPDKGIIKFRVDNNVWYEVSRSLQGAAGSPYVLPVATSTTLGGVKVGANIKLLGVSLDTIAVTDISATYVKPTGAAWGRNENVRNADKINFADYLFDVTGTAVAPATALTNARIAAVTAGGGTVYVPFGTYNLAATTVYSDVRVNYEIDGSTNFTGGGQIIGFADLPDGGFGKAYGKFANKVGNEHGLYSSVLVGTTGAPSGYEKTAMFARIVTQDIAGATNSNDSVGIQSIAETSNGITSGRIWGLDIIYNVVAGTDAYAKGIEIGCQNYGTNQPLIDQSNSKFGIDILASGVVNSTAAIIFGTAGAKFQDGLIVKDTSVNSKAIRVVTNGGASWNDVAYLDKAGNLFAASLVVGSSSVTSPTITTGTGVPSSVQPPSSIYLRQGGASGARFYVSAGAGVWNAAAGL